jgi:L-arginine dehydrogenase
MTIPPPLILDAAAVGRLLPQVDALGTMRSLFFELGRGRAVQPAQTLTLFPDGGGDFILYSGVLARHGVFGAKLSPYIPTEGRPIVTAWTLLMSTETGQPLLLCDSATLTTERTAATTALAVDLLARPQARRLAIFGSGPVATAHLHHLVGLRDWTDIRIFSPRLAASADRRRALQVDPRISFPETAAECATAADVIALATSSGKPVIDPAYIGQDTLVTSISTNAMEAHEVPPAFLHDAQVYCDNRATTPASAGEMAIARREHGWGAEAIRGDLAGLCCGDCPLPEEGRPVFFRSIGLGLEDVAIAHALWKVAREEREKA